MFPGMNPKKMQEMMKQLGIAQQEIRANRVVIETSDKEIIIDNPSVIRVKMQGQENFQISGDVSEQSLQENEEEKLEEDIQTIIEKTGCSEKKARETIKKVNGDLTEALLELS